MQAELGYIHQAYTDRQVAIDDNRAKYQILPVRRTAVRQSEAISRPPAARTDR